ncbi:type VII secretion protein EccCa [Actinomycetospora sp. OC33-EN08]|uniref:Type VII secretion protein EccCa n=1 Tax=Actinomycetospora aurantiaca TaxID=3129233 RepID=A0ABU8MNX9_9PSEU
MAMNDILVHRPPRGGPVRPTPEPVRLVEPPASTGGGPPTPWTYALFPLLGSGGILVFAIVNRNPIYFLAGGIFVIGALGMGVMMYLQTRGRTTEQGTDARLRYVAHLADVRGRLRAAADDQRRVAEEQHPDPPLLLGLPERAERLWERRPDDPDFLVLRVGRARIPGVAAPVLPEADPNQPRDPGTEAAAARLVDRLGPVPDVPVGVPLRGAVAVVGDPVRGRALARAVLAQLAALHAPDDVRLAVCCPDGPDAAAARAAWDWVKWLPHARHPSGGGADGTGLLVAEHPEGLLHLLGAELDRRRGGRRGPVPTAGAPAGPALVVLVDGPLPVPDPLGELPGLGVGVLHLVPDALDRPAAVDVTVHVGGHPGLEVRRDRDGAPPAELAPLAVVTGLVPDVLGLAEAETLARRLAPMRLSRRAGRTALAEVSGLADLLGVDDVAALDPERTWARRPESQLLRVPLGVDSAGTPVELDLKEAALSGMGPHGLVVGATGSGKSELLRTLVTGLAATHPPDDLALVLVDYKGGATFAGMAALPHVAGSITDLEDDPETVERFGDALRSELRRREQLLRDAGNLTGIREHRRLRLAGGDGPGVGPLPHLLVVVDEFSELLTAQPDFIELFVQVGRVGRSLGVHLLLATQRLEEGRLRGLDSHLSFRLALRTFSAAESRTVIGNTDAFDLPPVPGSAYLKVDTSVYRRLRVSTVSAPYVEPVRGRVRHPHARVFRAFDGRGDAVGDDLPALGLDLSDPARRSTLDVVVDRLRAAAEPVHQVWLPPLPAALPLTAVLPRPALTSGTGLLAPRPGRLAIGLGIVDRPDRQAQEALVVDLSGTGGHLGIVGAPRTGRSTALRTLVTAATLTHTPAELAVYAIDLGGGTLAGLERWPHVGGVAGRQRPEVVRRLVAQMESLVAGREGSPASGGAALAVRDGEPEVLLLVDDWGALRAEFEDLEPRLTALAARGLGHGLHLVVTAGRWWDMRPALRDALGTRIELRLGDPADSVIDRKAARTVPPTPGRALVGAGYKAQLALPVITDDAGRTEDAATTADRAAAAWPGAAAPPIRMLPGRVPLAELPPGAIGLRESDLTPLSLDLLGGRDPHLLVFGDAGSGRTATLRAVVRALCAAHPPEELRVLVVDYRRTLLDAVPPEHLSVYLGSAPAAAQTLPAAAAKMTARLPGPDVTPARLRARDWWQGPAMLVVVDDHDLVATPGGDPLAPLLDLLPQGRDIGLHVVLARSAGGASAAMMQPVLRRLRELGGPGLLHSGPRDEGALLHGVRAADLPPGRAQYVTRRAAPELVQIGWVPEAAD